ncbi:potassium-transporting ATPase subunit F [Cohnella herbarum]|uniref:Potassium-transporting ATPase subunit F n=1 Tax=Cohnella herbarum TaxID=2728023 RepID=A0A7Z2VNF2_9BACL|nr:potassium-transporting ATPase subunit F [Cohnella herbarum]
MRPGRQRCGRRAKMIIVSIFTVFIFLYLIYALVNPEKF